MTAQNPVKTPASDTELDAGPDAALELVRADGARGVLLVEAWVRHGNAAAVAAIAETAAGPARKAARRGLNVLKARGILPPPRARVASLSPQHDELVEEAHLLAPDGTGSVLLAIARRAGNRRTTATFVVLNDAVGVLRVDNDQLSHAKYLERLARALPGVGYEAVPVPVPWARWRIARALAEQARRGTPEPLGVMTARPLLEPVPSEAPEHPLDGEGLVLAPEDAAEFARNSARLHELPEFRRWLPPKQLVDAMLLEVGKTLTPNEEPPEGHVQAELEKQIQAATDRYFSPQVREQLAALLKDAALSVLARAGEQSALDVIATIHAINEAGLITNPPHEVPFLRGFFDKAIAILLAQNKGQLRIPVPQRPPTLEGEPEIPPSSTEPTAGTAGTPASEDAATGGDPATGDDPATPPNP